MDIYLHLLGIILISKSFMKSIRTLFFLSLLSAQAMAQVWSQDMFLQRPELTARDSLHRWAAQKGVKELKGFVKVGDELTLKRSSNFSKAGKLEAEYYYGSAMFIRNYYTYSGDTTLIRTITPAVRSLPTSNPLLKTVSTLQLKFLIFLLSYEVGTLRRAK